MVAPAEGLPTDKRELDLKTDFADVLAAGYTIHLWNTGGSVRVAEILRPGDQTGSHGTPKLGYGADGTAAKALVRARDSYFKRISQGKDFMSEGDVFAADAGYSVGFRIDGTFLDGISARSEISFYPANGRIMAEIPENSLGYGGKAYGQGDDMQAALDDLERTAKNLRTVRS